MRVEEIQSFSIFRLLTINIGAKEEIWVKEVNDIVTEKKKLLDELKKIWKIEKIIAKCESKNA